MPNWNWRHALCVTAILFLSACSSARVTECPPPVWADGPVGEELSLVPFKGYEDLWHWIAMVEVLNEMLAVCRE